MPRKRFFPPLFLFAFFLSFSAGSAQGAVLDASGQPWTASVPPERVLCSGSGCLRLLTYLGAQDRIVGVEDIEKRVQAVDPRPYFLANRWFAEKPLVGEFRGFLRPELVLGLEKPPQVIFKTDPEAGTPAVKIQSATGIPVIPLFYGNLTNQSEAFYTSLRAMGRVMGKQARAEELIRFVRVTAEDIRKRTAGLPETSKKRCYVGGISFRGAHGLLSTELGYPPFVFTESRTMAGKPGKAGAGAERAAVSKEDLLAWNPEVLFIDLSTLDATSRANALEGLRSDPLWKDLEAVRTGQVYGVLPYNWYTQNFECILANAYFVGKILYPDRFRDVDPVKKADEITRFFVGKALFKEMNGQFKGFAYRKINF